MAKKDGNKVAKSQGQPQAGPSKHKVSDELRQAVKDLGGDDEDLDLIAGVDSEDEASGPAHTKTKSSNVSKDEVSLRQSAATVP